MAAINPLAREVAFKIVFYGPGLGGKTTTLQHIHDASSPDRRGKMVSLATAVDRTLYFDFLPLRLPPVGGLNVRLQLFTVPGQVYYNATRKLVLNGADGIVFVADSQEARGDANLESLENLRENLAEQSRSLISVPHVFQYNKRDLPGVLSEDELNQTLNPHGALWLESVATRGEGVFESLEAITQAVVESFQRSRSGIPPASSPSAPLMSTSSDLGLASVLRSADHPLPVIPRTIALVSANVLEPARERPTDVIPDISSMSTPLLTDEDEITDSSQLLRSDGASRAPAPPTLLARVDEVDAIEQRMTNDRTNDVARRLGTTSDRPAETRDSAHLLGTPSSVPSPYSSPYPDSSQPPLTPSTTQPGRGAVYPPVQFSFAALWPEGEREAVREVEHAIASNEFFVAVDMLDRLAARMLAAAASLLGAASAPRDPAIVPVLLGLDGTRYLSFRRMVHEARSERLPDESTILAAYAFVLELRQARARILP